MLVLSRVMWTHSHFQHGWVAWLAFLTVSTDVKGFGALLPGTYVSDIV